MQDYSHITCVIFDCDGVLVDSEMISARILIGQLARVGVDVDFAYVQDNFLGRSWVKVAAEIRKAYGLKLDDDFETSYREALLKAYETELSTTSGITDVLEQLDMPICVATSSSPRRAARSLEITELAGFFKGTVFTASEVNNGKPAPDLFLHAAHKMGFEPAQCLVIEDSVPGILAAQSAGMDILRYMGGRHLSGKMPESEKRFPAVPHFDNWDKFFSIAPIFQRSKV